MGTLAVRLSHALARAENTEDLSLTAPRTGRRALGGGDDRLGAGEGVGGRLFYGLNIAEANARNEPVTRYYYFIKHTRRAWKRGEAGPVVGGGSRGRPSGARGPLR